jgi:Flp pilus assembly protein TadG
MKMVCKFRRDQQGAAAIEFAIAVPILILMIWGIFQVGIAFQASAGMQHALGEGARYATIWPVPTNTQIAARISSKTFGTCNGTFSTPSVTNGTNYKDLSVTFTMPMNFLFFNGPTLSLTRTKRVYTAA